MKNKKVKLSIYLLFIIIFVLIFYLFNNYFFKSSSIFIEEMEFEQVKVISEITQKEIIISETKDIKTLINKLDFKNWERLSVWDLKLSPYIYVVFDKNINIGFMKAEDNYYVLMENEKNYTYYKVPKKSYLYIESILK